MADNTGQSSLGSLGQTNVRTVLLAAVCLVAMVMLWWMYTEQGTIQRLATLNVPQTANTAPRESVQVLLQAPQPNITNIIVQERQKEEPKWNYDWDSLQWPNKEDANGVGVRTLVLVRHGKYDYDTGHLNDMGKQQANLTGARLKEMGMKFSKIYHSTMDRARETAEIIHKHLSDIPLQSDALLEEGGPIPPSPTVTYWGLPQRTYFVEGPRLESAFRKYFHRADKSQTEQSYELLVGHGNIFRFFALRALQLESSAWMRVYIAHASISVFHLNPDSTVSMTRFGDAGHFPNSLVTF